MATLAFENVPRLYRPQPEQDIHKAKAKTSNQSLLNLKLPSQSPNQKPTAKSEANRPVLDDVSVLARLQLGIRGAEKLRHVGDQKVAGFRELGFAVGFRAV